MLLNDGEMIGSQELNYKPSLGIFFCGGERLVFNQIFYIYRGTIVNSTFLSAGASLLIKFEQIKFKFKVKKETFLLLAGRQI